MSCLSTTKLPSFCLLSLLSCFVFLPSALFAEDGANEQAPIWGGNFHKWMTEETERRDRLATTLIATADFKRENPNVREEQRAAAIAAIGELRLEHACEHLWNDLLFRMRSERLVGNPAQDSLLGFPAAKALAKIGGRRAYETLAERLARRPPNDFERSLMIFVIRHMDGEQGGLGRLHGLLAWRVHDVSMLGPEAVEGDSCVRELRMLIEQYEKTDFSKRAVWPSVVAVQRSGPL